MQHLAHEEVEKLLEGAECSKLVWRREPRAELTTCCVLSFLRRRALTLLHLTCEGDLLKSPVAKDGFLPLHTRKQLVCQGLSTLSVMCHFRTDFEERHEDATLPLHHK